MVADSDGAVGLVRNAESHMKEPGTFKSAVRQQESLLTPLEKRTLAWLAHRLNATDS